MPAGEWYEMCWVGLGMRKYDLCCYNSSVVRRSSIIEHSTCIFMMELGPLVPMDYFTLDRFRPKSIKRAT